MEQDERHSLRWWAAYSALILPMCVVVAVAWDFPVFLVPLALAAGASFRLADLVMVWCKRHNI